MAGNKFVNGILYGAAQAFSMLFSQQLLKRLPDIIAFRVVAILAFASYSMLIAFKDNSLMTYIAIFLLVTSVGGWNNVFMLIMEMRVPPSNIAAVAIVVRTISVGVCMISATVAA